MTKRPAFTDLVRYAALAAAMVISFATQRDLALSHGVPASVAPAVPVAIDLFMIWAVRSARDVALSVAAAVSANVAGVLTAESLSAVGTWVSAGLHAVFPLTVWRMHRAEPGKPAEALRDSWPGDDLWQDFEAADAPDSEADSPVTPPSAEDIRAAVKVLESRHGRPVTGALVADHFGVSERTGRRYLSMTA
ncbi:transfer protein spdA [Streptomyces sp. NPDC002559]